MKFLLISDLHFCPDKDGRESRELREKLPKYIVDNNLQVQELFVAGDYRHAGIQKNEPIETVADKVVELIWKIAHAAGISDATHIHLIPGNHDRSRSVLAEDKKRLQRIRQSYNSRNGNFRAEDLSFLVAQFAFFRAVCDRLYGNDNPWTENDLHIYRVMDQMVLLCLNTAIMHNKDRDRGKLIIGNDEMSLLLEEISKRYPQSPIIVLAHHSLEFFEMNEREAVEQLLRQYPVVLYLCGDAHQVWWRSVNERLEITMGCLKTGENIQAAFLYGDTDIREYKAYHWDGKFGSKYGWGPYTQFNDSISCVKEQAGLTVEIIEHDQGLLKNEVLLPWMRRSKSYQAVFPEIFIRPILKGVKIQGEFLYPDILLRYKNKNIAVIGDAGYGKSTLLRYIYLYENVDHEFLYLKADALRRKPLSSYEKGVLALLEGNENDCGHKTILLDGMDEVFLDASDELQEFIMKLCEKPDYISVWFGWRSENYYQRETEGLQRFLTNVISLQEWEEDMIKKYVDLYAQKVRKPEILEKFTHLADRHEVILGFSKIPFQLVLLLYLLENDELSSESKLLQFDAASPITYTLYRQFFICWIRKERNRETSCLTEEEIKTELCRIAWELYYGDRCVTTCRDTAVTDLLVFSSNEIQKDGEQVAKNFYHRSLCAFFYSIYIFDAIKIGGKTLVSALSQPLRNDVTDFLRSAIATIQSHEELGRLQKNLMDTYRQAAMPEKHILSHEVRRKIAALSEENLFCLKNELIYLVTRLPPLAAGVDSFVAEAYKQETEPYLKLDIAYGAVLTGPSWVGLEYAGALRPGTEEDLVNRSWTLAYYGDVQANPYHYRDSGTCSWAKAKAARLKRFQSNKRKAIRFRIMDFPLMYCFYESRNWSSVNKRELEIIKCAEVDREEYTEEEKRFLVEQKKRLISEYEKRLSKGSQS